MSWQRLSHWSTKRSTHVCERNWGSNRCRACRWFEVVIESRPTRPASDPLSRPEFRVTVMGGSRVPGEVHRVKTIDTTSADALLEYLVLEKDGRRYLPRASRHALMEAGETHREIAVALSRFNHPSNERHR